MKLYLPPTPTPEVPKSQSGRALLNCASISAVSCGNCEAAHDCEPTSLSASAAAYNMFETPNGGSTKQTLVGPADPRTPVGSAAKLARTRMVAGETTTCDQMSTAAWNAALAAG